MYDVYGISQKSHAMIVNEVHPLVLQNAKMTTQRNVMTVTVMDVIEVAHLAAVWTLGQL